MTSTNQRPINMTVWVCQWILAGAFEFIGMIKLGLTAELVQRFGLAAEASTAMLQTVALVEIGLSLLAILPAVTRVLPQLSTVAAADDVWRDRHPRFGQKPSTEIRSDQRRVTAVPRRTQPAPTLFVFHEERMIGSRKASGRQTAHGDEKTEDP